MHRRCMATVGGGLRKCQEQVRHVTYHAVKRGTVAGTAQVTHGPDSRPKTADVVEAGKHDRRLNQTSSETELVPGLHHATRVVEVVVNLL